MKTLDERNQELNDKIAGSDLDQAVAALLADAKKRRRQIRLLFISIILDILLTIGLTGLSLVTHQLASNAENAQDAIIHSCQVGNEARANNKQLWAYLLSLPTPNPPTLEQQKVRQQFADFVDKTFAPRDCNKEINQ